MMRTASSTIDPDSALISLSLKPRRNWTSFITAIFGFCGACFCIVVIVIEMLTYDLLERFYLLGLIAEAPTEKYDWLLIALVVLMIFIVINETTKATKSFWFTKDVDKDINTKDLVILRPISKSDLR